MEEVANHIYRIGVPLPDNPLREVNSYFIRGDEWDLLIDTGLRRPECREALRTGLAELGAKRERLNVLSTHVHSDHSGLVMEMAGDERTIWLSRTDLDYLRGVVDGRYLRGQHVRFVEEGFPETVVEHIEHNNPTRIYALMETDDRFAPLEDGEHLHVGEHDLEVIVVPGHSPGNTMLWLEKEKIMFTGDHILFDITPNITAFVDVEDSLGSYLDSLRRVRAYPVELALPGHRKRGDYHARIDQLLAHHERRIAEAEQIVRDTPGLTAYDITGHMTWKIRARDWDSFPENQKWYAVGECLSHLDYLLKRGRIARDWDGSVWRYHCL